MVETLVSVFLAKVNVEFLFLGGCPFKDRCKYVYICQENLKIGRIYRVVRVKDKFFNCFFHDEKVRVVSVETSPLEVALSQKNVYKETIVRCLLPNCEFYYCENYFLCNPPGLKSSDACKVLEVIGRIKKCRLGFSPVACKVALT